MRKVNLFALAVFVSAFVGYMVVKNVMESFEDLDLVFEDDDETNSL